MRKIIVQVEDVLKTLLPADEISYLQDRANGGQIKEILAGLRELYPNFQPREGGS